MITCDALVRGSIYGRKGGNRYDPCTAPAKYHVEREQSGVTVDVCGTHLRRFSSMNRSLWRTDDLLKRARREPYYVITEVAS